MSVKKRLIVEGPAAPDGRAPARQVSHEAPHLGERTPRLKEWPEQDHDALLTGFKTGCNRPSSARSSRSGACVNPAPGRCERDDQNHGADSESLSR